TADLGRARAALEAANLRLRHTSRDLYESKQLLQAVFDHSPNAIVIKGLDGSFLLSNRRFQQILGRTAADLMGKTDFDVLPPDEAKKHLAVDAAAIKAGGAVQYEEAGNVQGQNHAFLETIFPLRDESGKAFGVCWIGTEITEIKHAEDALARTAAELTEAQRVAHIGSWMFDLDTEFMTWSEELYRIHGLDPSHPAPKHREEYQRLFPQQSRAALSAATERLKRDRVPYELEVETILPDGSTRWISVRGEPMADASGRLVAVRGTAQDVTQLKQLQRMKEEWMSVIGHDLRQPVGIIKMSVELLPELHVGEINARERETTERIRAAANGIARMIDDLLDMSRIEAHRLSLERVWMDPCPLVRHTVSSLAHITGDRTVEVTDDASVSKVFVDLMRFEQVLGNLLSNAVKYGDKGAAIHVHVAQHGHDVEISVSNHGPGLTRDDVSRLFSRFGRVSTSHVSGIQGLGLGLYIANGLVEAHGGHMWVDSVPGQTTTFHFTLPSRVASDIAA
ncbi:MAG: PAS domain-containing sensor histidine kinase, partial [Gemmatimonadaceae bacterium]